MLIDREHRERAQKLVWTLTQATKDVAQLVDYARGPHNELNDSAKRLGHEVVDAHERAEKFLELYDRRLALETAARQKEVAK